MIQDRYITGDKLERLRAIDPTALSEKQFIMEMKYIYSHMHEEIMVAYAKRVWKRANDPEFDKKCREEEEAEKKNSKKDNKPNLIPENLSMDDSRGKKVDLDETHLDDLPVSTIEVDEASRASTLDTSIQYDVSDGKKPIKPLTVTKGPTSFKGMGRKMSAHLDEEEEKIDEIVKEKPILDMIDETEEGKEKISEIVCDKNKIVVE